MVEFYNLAAIPALINREKAVESAAIADNADLRQQAEAVIAEQKSITTTAIAANAARKQAADARKAKAAAIKATADAETADATASNSPVKARAEADAQSALAKITQQEAIVEKEKAKQSDRKFRAETETQQIKVAMQKIVNLLSQNRVELCGDCDPTYCILCNKRYVPDLPSGAELPPPLPDDAPTAIRADAPVQATTPQLPSSKALHPRGTVVAIQLNVHSKPSPDADTIVGKLDHGQTVEITAQIDNGWVAIEATCNDGTACRGYVNGRREFVAPSK